MKIRFTPYFMALFVLLFGLYGCAKYTDFVPKGQNLLNRADDLDQLMNVNYSGSAFNFNRLSLIVNDMYLLAYNVPNVISSNVLTMDKVLLTYDESADRAALTATDSRYDGLYKNIAMVANIVLANADQASGDRKLLDQLKAEAYALRSYMHFLLVNMYAKAYDPATAATDGGIPYVTDINFEQINPKLTVQEVYDRMLADVDAAIASQALPDRPKNSMRFGKAFAYALKAKILMSIRNYSGALDAVNSALAINNTLEDHRYLLSEPVRANRVLSRKGLTAQDNLFYAFSDTFDPSLLTPTYEILSDYYEPGNIIKDYTNVYNYQLGPLYVGLPDIPAWIAISYEGNSGGMTVSDLVMMKAECLIRSDKVSAGMEEIEKIRIRRIAPEVYKPLVAKDVATAMAHLKKVSRIEFLFTWRNFVNIKRWNTEPAYAETTKRIINGKTYVLKASSPLWILPFPQSATQFNTTLTQNY
ncbi:MULTISPECIES: RagB/SusD family nutrient uptake outer membrane protein [Sphingobacterium]|uniref:RagB/SusD family nutrient uptake outer membrane protein n=1 Tax=Sphingobacterium hotanense TaxID=649196 RepID=A0ABT7NMF5_9SPHI|nr:MULTISPECIES: RagB/SusD family nutrient uptake outer membrane protein [Sphingobacterium]MDM1048330.1 RagB/SusD family nutrient uptake outer membrane protein [Sphingobacterium hotanense]